MIGHKSTQQNCFFQIKKKNHEYIIQIICAGITYIIGNTQVYDSVMADVMKKIATQKRQNMSTLKREKNYIIL